jgi:methionyl-tRNA synthetase
MREFKRILVTAALPYANGPIHLGHLAGAYLPSDMYVRFQRLMGREVAFICGSDEHGVPITLTADKEHITPQAVVDRYHAINKASFEQFGISFDNYSRTSLPLHHQTAVEFFLSFYKHGVLREKKEKQFFDPKANMFLPDRYVEGTCPVCGNPEARGDQCEQCGSFLNPTELLNPKSKITGETPVLRETSHLYFPLGAYQEKLRAFIDERNKRDGWKDNVLKYCQSWFTEGLQDRAVTRDLDWGVKIPLPGYESKVLYVWFDAVLGYISSTKEWSQRIGKPDEWKKFWLDESTKYVAFIGKDNIVFHCIVFPAMLMAWNESNATQYLLPENVPANEFLNFEGEKFSKSRGVGIDVQDFLARFPADPLRYYLASSLPEYRDADFYWKDFQAKTNNELADILGNFVHRTLAFAGRTFNGIVPERGDLTPLDQAMIDLLQKTPDAVATCFEQYRFRDGLLEAMNLARAANKYFNDSEPWKTAKTDPARCATTINIGIQVARASAILMFPIIPGASERIWRMLALKDDVARQRWHSAGETPIPAGHTLGTPEILFTKIEDDVIDQAIRDTTNVVQAQSLPSPSAPEAKPTITIDDFKKIDLRVAKIVECEVVPKSEKLLKLQMQIGTERRQVVAGIAKHYKPEDLIGKSVVVVYNLQAAKLMGQESKGMVLAASDDEGKLFIVAPSGEIASGSVVR